MVPTRTVLLLAIICIGIAMVTPAAYSDEDIEDDKLANVNVLEDLFTVLNDKDKRRVCTDKKSHSWCKFRKLFFHDCRHKSMKRNCKATCRQCRG